MTKIIYFPEEFFNRLPLYWSDIPDFAIVFLSRYSYRCLIAVFSMHSLFVQLHQMSYSWIDSHYAKHLIHILHTPLSPLLYYAYYLTKWGWIMQHFFYILFTILCCRKCISRHKYVKFGLHVLNVHIIEYIYVSNSFH